MTSETPSAAERREARISQTRQMSCHEKFTHSDWMYRLTNGEWIEAIELLAVKCERLEREKADGRNVEEFYR